MQALRRRYGAIRYKPGATAHGFLRRGPATNAMWMRVVGATNGYTKEPMAVETARALFDSDKRIRMVRVGEGTLKYPFLLSIQGPDVYIELEARS